MKRNLVFKIGLKIFLVTVSLANSCSSFAAGGVTIVSVPLEQVFESPRWMFESKVKITGGPLANLMVEAKKGLMAKERARCLNALQKSYTLGKSLAPWLAWNQLQCAQLRDKKGNLSLDELNSAIAKVDAQPKWLLLGPSAGVLKKDYVSALLLLAEQQTKTDRRSAWKTFDKLSQIRPWLNAEERANTYRWAGEVAFVEQNLAAAQDFLLRSLNEKESADLRVRIESIRATLLADKKSVRDKESAGASEAETDKLADKTPALKVAPKTIEDLGMTDEERDIYSRLKRSVDSQDFLSAIVDGVELIIKYPGSRRSLEASDKVLEIYLGLAARTDEKFRHVRQRAVQEMAKADAGRLARWANNAYARGNYLDALQFSEKAFTKYDGHPDSTKILLLAGKAALACGEYGDAQEHFELLLKKDGGTPEAIEASFRLGLLLYRAKKYSEAAAAFERLLALNGSKDYEYRALYWQWRAQEKLDKDKSAVYAQPLILKYPLSYYGLRAKAELNNGALEISNKPVHIKVDFRFLDTERLAWERLNVLLKAGWCKEAEKELDALPDAQSVDERLVRAKLWASTLRYDNAVQNINKALEESPELQRISILKIVFPREYAAYISRESKSLGLAEEWIRSLMRQESTFRPDARSSSNALGVMQLLPATANDLVKDLKIKDFQVPESLLDPEINIKLGSTYLNRMVRNFNGNMPLALAAYNAGPTRLRRWLDARKDLAGIENQKSSAPEVELWMDELPWDETSFYVKAILRNWMIYRLLEGSKMALAEPIWLDAKASAR